ncbi:MAG: zinc-ribbon domain-containing protein [Eubacterium sp.]|nr:zinc-ribbon domain-containing protein [Eubacterium sp.]SEF67732.1 zinc-ribbon domain-containing protein [Eubacterium ruminantium]
MICRHCGKEIPDNSEYCEYCNESTFEKIVLGEGALEKARDAEKEARKQESPILVRAFYGAKEGAKRRSEEKQERKSDPKVRTIPFYKKKEAFTIGVILSFIPAVFIGLSIFLNWIYMWVKMKEKITSNFSMKDIVRESLKSGKNIGQKREFANYIPLICMIIMIIIAIYMIYIAFIDLFPKKNIFMPEPVRKHGFIARVVPFVLLVLVLIVFTHSRMYKGMRNSVNNLLSSYSAFSGFDDKNMSGFGHGLGFFIAILSPIFYVISKVYMFIYNTLNEEE